LFAHQINFFACNVYTQQDFKMPRQWSVTCNAKPSLFAYPKKLEEKKEEKKERVTTVTLSTTAKAKAREHRKEQEKKKDDGDTPSVPTAESTADSMDVDTAAAAKTSTATATGTTASSSAKSGDEGVEESKGSEASDDKPAVDSTADDTSAAAAVTTATKKKKREPEPASFTCGNPSRITPSQEAVVSFDLQQRYVPVRAVGKAVGIIMLCDRAPGESEDVANVEAPAAAGQEEEAEPPQAFEWKP
jgi:26S proteasome regulatory subunit N2